VKGPLGVNGCTLMDYMKITRPLRYILMHF